MACDFSSLSNIDPANPEQTQALLRECTAALTDPKLWLWTIVITIVCAAVGAWIGTRKNSVVRDAILGAALGPIGWVISWFLPAAKPKPVCPVCKHAVDGQDKHCRHCGIKLAS
ncbi:MAG: hypothetical protein ABI304_07445 [Rudaea sp.]